MLYPHMSYNHGNSAEKLVYYIKLYLFIMQNMYFIPTSQFINLLKPLNVYLFRSLALSGLQFLLIFQLVQSSRNEYLKLKARVENLQRTQRQVEFVLEFFSFHVK